LKGARQAFDMEDLSWVKLDLAKDEEDILAGKRGRVLQKVMKTVVLYGQACGAKKLVPIEGSAHLVISMDFPGLGPRLEMIDELIGAGLKTRDPFTVDPRAVDLVNLSCSPRQERLFREWGRNQPRYEQQLERLGLRDDNAFTCACYLPEVGNRPNKGAVLAWSESSAVVFANSVLGARTNRNGAILDLLCNLAGRAPLFGLLTDEGRRAGWRVEIATSRLPDPQLLGGAIGKKVQEGVPYIICLDRFLGPGLSKKTEDFLKDMGAACAALGACGLYHAENITPEALDQKRKLLIEGHRTYVIDDHKLKETRTSYPVLWRDKGERPKRCLIGCPHLSLGQLYWWVTRIHQVRSAYGKRKADIEIVLFAAPDVLGKFKKDRQASDLAEASGVKLSAICIETFMKNPFVAREPVMTNSNKLRAYTTARFLPDQEILDVIASGELREGGIG
jgi:predicted aconitase